MRYPSQLVRYMACWLVVVAMAAGSAQAAERLYAAARGYRVIDYRWDAVLLQRWAVLQDAVHPERPLLSERVESSSLDVHVASQAAGAAAVVKNAMPVIRLGDPVTLWSEDGNIRMELGAVSRQNAAVGDRIQLRVTGAGVNGSTGWQATGIVRGPGSVEMER